MLGAIGAAFQIGGQLVQGYANFRQAQAQQLAQEFNASELERQARDTAITGQFDSGQAILQARKIRGAQRVGFASSGVDVNTGTAAAVQDTALLQGLNAADMLRFNAAKKAHGLNTQAAWARYAGDTAMQGGRYSAIGSGFGVAGTALGAASQAGAFSGSQSQMRYGNSPSNWSA